MDYNSLMIKRLRPRIEQISFLLKELKIKEVYIAGNCLNRSDPRDIDLFPVNGTDFKDIYKIISDNNIEGALILSKTKNALTIKYNKKVIQFCNYYHESLEKLVNSFDFAHIQIGTKIVIENSINIKEIYFTDNYKESKLLEYTAYVHSEYPLSSLIRLIKYQERGEFAGKSYIFSIFKILRDLIKRGFLDYNDFKNQLDAVDLGILPEDFSEFSQDQGELFELFELLNKEEKKIF